MKSQQHCRCVWSGLVWSAFFCTSFLLTAPGVRALKFLQDPRLFQQSYVGFTIDFNCTTDDPNARVSLLQSKDFGFSYNVISVTPNKLLLRKQVFTIVNLILSDGAHYKCKATDQSGQTIEGPDVQLSVGTVKEPKLEFIPNKQPIYVLQGQSGEVTCEAEGPSVSTLKWEKQQDDKSYAAVPNSQVNITKDANYVRAVLKITNAQFADTGTYKCTVQYQPNKSKHKETNITVLAPLAPTILSNTRQVTIREGSTKAIRCKAKGHLKPTVKWYRDGEKLNVTNCHANPQSCDKVNYEVYEEGDGSSGLHTIYTVQVLKIRSALYPRDVGDFKCVASNGVSPDAELIVSLDVQVSPRIEKRGSEVSIEEGKEATISCRVTKSNPLPTFSWQYAVITSLKEDRWNTVPGRLILTDSSTPSNESIVKVEKDQGGAEYRCEARNSLESDFYIFRLVRLAKKLMIDTVKTLPEVNEKSTLHVYCIATDQSYGLLDIVFLKDGEKIQLSNPRVNVTFEQLPRNKKQFDLTIKNVSLNDTGHYGCTTAKSFPKLLSSINITVKALKAPHISDIPDVQVVQKTQGGNAELHCDVTGNPKPSITWYFSKNGKIKEINREKDDLDGHKDNCKSRKSGYYLLQPGNASVLVICNPQFEYHEGKYWCRANNTEGSQNRSAFVNVKMAPVITEPEEGYAHLSLKIGEPLNISCVAVGNPAPSVTWLKNSTGKAVSPTSTNSQRLIIKSMEDKDFRLYSCIASNNLSHTMASVDIKKKESIPVVLDGGLSTGTLVGIAIGVSVFVLILLVVCCCLYHRQKKQIDEYKQLYFLKTSSDYKIDPDRSLLEQCNDLPYDPDWEFPEERLILGNVLGAGAFGQVVAAEAIGILALNPRDKSAESFKRRSKIRRSSVAKDLKKEGGGSGWKNVKVPVAVKTLKEGATEAEYKDLASELKILIHLGQHKNIINLLGACTKGKRLMVIMEFAPHGSLLNFLRARRETYDASWTKTMNEPEKEFTLVDLVMIGFQVGRGMSFLASKKCVHRDLAARNILVGDDYVMKIADFGLARDIYKDDQYVKNTQGLLPVKWMAPESLFDRVYTEKTDVWSFGILLWETFTLGGTPYPGLPTELLLDYLSDGKRMDMPTKCPLEVYTIMRDCWIHEPEQRPHFTTLTERLAKILEKHTTTDNPYLALQMDEEVQPSSGYYLQPVDNAGVREFKRYVKSPVQSPTSDTQEPPQFEDLEGGQYRYDSPLPTLPPGLPASSDDEIPTEPLPQTPPPFENDVMDERRFLERENSAGWESGIDMDPTDDGYVDDVQVATPFLPRTGYTLVGIDMENVSEPNVFSKGNREKTETSV